VQQRTRTVTPALATITTRHLSIICPGRTCGRRVWRQWLGVGVAEIGEDAQRCCQAIGGDGVAGGGWVSPRWVRVSASSYGCRAPVVEVVGAARRNWRRGGSGRVGGGRSRAVPGGRLAVPVAEFLKQRKRFLAAVSAPAGARRAVAWYQPTAPGRRLAPVVAGGPEQGQHPFGVVECLVGAAPCPSKR